MGATERQVSGEAMTFILECVRSRGGDSAVLEVLALAGETRTEAEIRDESRWSTHEQKLAVLEAAAQVLGDPGIARRMGESLFEHKTIPATKLALRLLGSPQQVMRALRRTTRRRSSVAIMEATDVSPTHATVRYQVCEGFRPHRMDCDYHAGMLSQIGPMFGLPTARVDHFECQVDGAPWCVYQVRWKARSRLPWRSLRHKRALELEVLNEQVAAAIEGGASLSSTITDLVSETGVEEVLDRIGNRAMQATLGTGFLIHVRWGPRAEHIVRSYGLDETELARASEMLAVEPAMLASGWTAARVVSTRAFYGHLAVLDSEPDVGVEGSERILDLYASYAALALDLHFAFEEARVGRETAEALLDLARELAEPVSREEVAERLARAVRRIAGADLSCVLLWEPTTRSVRMAAADGFPEEISSSLMQIVVGADGTPDLERMLSNLRPQQLNVEDAPAAVRALTDRYGSFGGITWPIAARGEFLGVLWIGAASGRPPIRVTPVLASTIGAVADEASIAFERARLLASDEELDRRLQVEAYHDRLTGLPNTALFRDRLGARVDRARRFGRHEAVILLDIDNFGAVNNRFGRTLGDTLLVQIAERIRAEVREDDLVARIDSDKFGLICSVRESADAVVVVRNVIDALAAPFQVDDVEGAEEVRVTVSVGTSIGPGHGTEPDGLLVCADIALQSARESGGRASMLYDPTMGTRAHDRFTLENRLRQALLDDELVLYYQPQIDLFTGRIVGAEALLRWQHPEQGLQLPGSFIPIAEDSGLIVPMGEWVLREACVQAREWQDRGLRPITMAVNVSVRQVQREPGFAAMVAEVLEETGLDPKYLELEMTESFSAHNLDVIASALQGLREKGVAVAIDDFGTGYAFFGYIQRFPIGRVKIDQSFVQSIGVANDEGAIVRGMLDMTMTLDVDVVAEGVETMEQFEFLRRYGCQQGQGYLFGYPVPAEEFAKLLAEDRIMTRIS